ncbi:MAG: Lrp/AsnC ligand binding domain-containing protein [Devosiaceae bacterium]|nr:Lrp/AsnC ligand binding domain-containing protein [Devosiaceae bacterium MH13]
MICVFVQIQCKPGSTYDVANKLSWDEKYSEMYSTSGEFDLLLKIYVPKTEDIGRFISDNISQIDGIERTLTTIAFSAH